MRERRDDETKLWNKRRYFIYYNQRAIEALTYHLLFVGEEQSEEEVLQVAVRRLREMVAQSFDDVRDKMIDTVMTRVLQQARVFRSREPLFKAFPGGELLTKIQEGADKIDSR